MRVFIDVDEAYPVYRAYSLDDYNMDRDSIVVELSEFDYGLYIAIDRIHNIMQNKLTMLYREALASGENK